MFQVSRLGLYKENDNNNCYRKSHNYDFYETVINIDTLH